MLMGSADGAIALWPLDAGHRPKQKLALAHPPPPASHRTTRPLPGISYADHRVLSVRLLPEATGPLSAVSVTAQSVAIFDVLRLGLPTMLLPVRANAVGVLRANKLTKAVPSPRTILKTPRQAKSNSCVAWTSARVRRTGPRWGTQPAASRLAHLTTHASGRYGHHHRRWHKTSCMRLTELSLGVVQCSVQVAGSIPTTLGTAGRAVRAIVWHPFRSHWFASAGTENSLDQRDVPRF